jgi:hypothetical protein
LLRSGAWCPAGGVDGHGRVAAGPQRAIAGFEGEKLGEGSAARIGDIEFG